MPQSINRLDLSAALGDWSLWTAAPPASLATLVKEFWEVRGNVAAFREAVLPNGHVEMMFNLGPVHHVLDGPAAGEWTHSWLSGFHERAIHIESLNGTHLLSARLHPLGAAMLLGDAVPASVNRIVELGHIIGDDAGALRAAAMANDSVEHHFALLETFLLARLPRAWAIPPFVWTVARSIEAAHGRARIAEMHEELGVSRKHLAVSFRRYVGISAKRYALTQRFVRALAHLQNGQDIEWSSLADAAGYSDQSHLVRDFRRVGAASPKEYVRRVLPGATALLED